MKDGGWRMEDGGWMDGWMENAQRNGGGIGKWAMRELLVAMVVKVVVVIGGGHREKHLRTFHICWGLC